MEKYTKPKVDKYINLYSKYAKAEDLTHSTEGFVSSVNITNYGFYYDDGILDQYDSSGNPYLEYPPTITFSAPQVGSDRTTGTPIIDGSGLVGINITNNTIFCKCYSYMSPRLNWYYIRFTIRICNCFCQLPHFICIC